MNINALCHMSVPVLIWFMGILDHSTSSSQTFPVREIHTSFISPFDATGPKGRETWGEDDFYWECTRSAQSYHAELYKAQSPHFSLFLWRSSWLSATAPLRHRCLLQENLIWERDDVLNQEPGVSVPRDWPNFLQTQMCRACGRVPWCERPLKLIEVVWELLKWGLVLNLYRNFSLWASQLSHHY